jgi:hypothetical protein
LEWGSSSIVILPIMDRLSETDKTRWISVNYPPASFVEEFLPA